jgi:hypothetical protein
MGRDWLKGFCPNKQSLKMGEEDYEEDKEGRGVKIIISIGR